MSEIGKVYTWHGQKLEDLSRDDLMRALVWSFHEMERMREEAKERSKQHMDFVVMASRAKRELLW